jgi:CHAD domain-containing protein
VSFRLLDNESIEQRLVRLVGKQAQNAQECLGPKRRIADQQIHSARKSIKRARAALRLFRCALPKATFTRLNLTLRDAARPLTYVRDAKVLLDTLASVREYFGAAASCIPTDVLERKLKAQLAYARRTVRASSTALAGARRDLQQVMTDIDRARLRDAGWDALGPAIRRVYRHGREALREVGVERSDEKLHEWRKRVKHLWHALQILEPLRPALLGELADQAHTLADLLGDDHDLAILSQRVVEDDSAQARATQALIGLIVTRRQALQERALALGGQLFLDKPKRFELRLEKYWRNWQHEGAQATAEHAA